MKLVFFHSNFTSSAPSAKCLVAAVPILLKQGFKVMVYCWEAQEEIEGLEVVKLPKWSPSKFLDDWVFALLGFLISGWLRLSRKSTEDAVLIATDQYAYFADIANVQFAHFHWLSWQYAIPCQSWRERVQVLVTCPQLVVAGGMICWNPFLRVLMANSEGFAKHLRKVSAPWVKVIAIPNVVETQEFTIEKERLARSVVRERWGIGEKEIVFCFCSMGHFRRKGLWTAIQAVGKLRQLCPEVPIRFMLIGGTEHAVNRVRAICRRLLGEDAQWLILTGMVKDVFENMAAADAFLFPSYSDTFCIAAYESAGLGMRTYLTPFHGAQTLLKDYKNAKQIDWNVDNIASILKDDIEHNRIVRMEKNRMGVSSSQSYAEHLIEALRRVG